jgi:hypothetical protein
MWNRPFCQKNAHEMQTLGPSQAVIARRVVDQLRPTATFTGSPEMPPATVLPSTVRCLFPAASCGGPISTEVRIFTVHLGGR